MKSVAILMDGGFVLIKLAESLKDKELVSAKHVVTFAKRCLAKDEELFRIYYYDCWPYSGKEWHPVTRQPIDIEKTSVFQRQERLLSELPLRDNVAFRKGDLNFAGWTLTRKALTSLLRKPRDLAEDDYRPELNQKGVDIKMGLDIAWLSSKRIVDKIILITSDSDLVPAMKFARREGIQVVLVTMGHKLPKKSLRIHADEVREILPG